MATSPATFDNSSRIGPETSNDRSKLPDTEGPIWQPASTKTKGSNAMSASNLSCRLILPPAPRLALRWTSLTEDTRLQGNMFRLFKVAGPPPTEPDPHSANL